MNLFKNQFHSQSNINFVISEFLATHKIQHRLYFSTLPKLWNLIFEDRLSLKRLKDLNSQCKNSECLTSLSPPQPGVLNAYFQLCGHLVTVLSLETSLNDDQDLTFLTLIFQQLPNLRKVTLDISQIRRDINLLYSLPSNLIPRTIKTATFKVYDEVAPRIYGNHEIVCNLVVFYYRSNVSCRRRKAKSF